MKGEKPEPGFLGFGDNFLFFAGVKVSLLEPLASACRFRRVNKGEIRFFPCDPAESVYVVCTGTVAIMLNRADGRELAIDQMHAKQVFGDLEVLTRKTRSTGAVARSACELLILPFRIFLNLLDTEPGKVLQVPPGTHHKLMSDSARSSLVLLQMTRRLGELPSFAGYDQRLMQERRAAPAEG